MSNSPIAIIVITIGQVLSMIIIADALLSFVMPREHPFREALGRILQPLYAPLRRVIPPLGMMDFTPLILLIIIQFVVRLLTSIL